MLKRFLKSVAISAILAASCQTALAEGISIPDMLPQDPLSGLVSEETPDNATPKDVEGWVKSGKLYYFGNERFFRENFQEAHNFFLKAAKYHHPEAYYFLATMYMEGKGVMRDEARGELLYRTAAELGHVESQMILGVLLIQQSINIKPESEDQQALFREAAKWLKPAAEKGNAEAQFWYGDMLVKGTGVERNVVRGINLVRKSAAQNNANGQGMLSAYYWQGTGVKKDLVAAYQWALLAIEGGNRNMLAIKQRIAKDMTQEDIDKATTLAEAWKQEHLKKLKEGISQ